MTSAGALLAEVLAVFTSGLAVIVGAKATGSVYTRLCSAPVASEALVTLNELPPGGALMVPHVAVPVGVQPGADVKVTPLGSVSARLRSIAPARPLLVTV